MADTFQNPLNTDYGLRFSESDIPDVHLRPMVNSSLRKMRAINSIATLLHNNHIALDAEGRGKCFAPVLASGLFDALIELSGSGDVEAEALGLQISRITKGRAHG